jgi:hypothetical protein
MSLSDELLRRRESLREVRAELSDLRSAIEARACFMVDEAGSPFGAVGNVEFEYPHPLSGLLSNAAGGTALLEALVGEAVQTSPGSPWVLRRVTPRALLVAVFPGPLSSRAEHKVTRRLKEFSSRLEAVLGDLPRRL